jgi:hypothetical protein
LYSPPPLALLLLANGDVEVEVEVAAERGRRGKLHPIRALVRLELGEGSARHADRCPSWFVQMDDGAVEAVHAIAEHAGQPAVYSGPTTKW